MKWNPEAYKKSGVDLDTADEIVNRIKPLALKTVRPEVLKGLGGFGGLFDLNKQHWKDPILVSGADGVGTKLKLAFEMQKHNTIGIDLVAMCVNDILVQGAEPLFFLDYLAFGKLHPDRVESIVGGISEGCLEAGCALLGGETAEMPGMYEPGEYELAGFTVGAVEKEELIDGSKIVPGDVLLGLTSNGVHSNGFSLVRKILQDSNVHFNEVQKDCLKKESREEKRNIGEILLEPTRIYVRSIMKLKETVSIKGMAHITGGGLPGNLPRMIPEGTAVELHIEEWPKMPLFNWLQKSGKLSNSEIYPVFNMGIGYVICVADHDVGVAISCLNEMEEKTYKIGKIISGNRSVSLT